MNENTRNAIIIIAFVILIIMMLRESIFAFGFAEGWVVGSFIISPFFLVLALVALVLAIYWRSR